MTLRLLPLLWLAGWSLLVPARGGPRYDEVLWLATHNAFNASEDGFLLPNQGRGLAGQLQDGIRAFLLDVHAQDGQLVLRHGDHAWARRLGSAPLAPALEQFTTFLHEHPHAVLTLWFENHADPEALAAALEQAGLDAFAWSQPTRQPWPELAELRAQGRRAVLFLQEGESPRPWLLPLWDHARDTPYSAACAGDLRNAGGRGQDSAGLLIVNHFLTRISGSPELAATIHGADFLRERLEAAEKELRDRPTLLVVDFYEVGEGIEVVNARNEAWADDPSVPRLRRAAAEQDQR